jgi:hypothetical protein
MGLDIVAYSNLTPVGLHTDEWCEDEDHIAAYAYKEFPRSFRGIAILDEDPPFVRGGCYAKTGKTESMSFRAGSYGEYNRWRTELQNRFNIGPDEDRPFYELIWFVDNEGTIGPEAARDLLADFEAAGDQSDEFGPNWTDFREACRLAADNGLIEFCC